MSNWGRPASGGNGGGGWGSRNCGDDTGRIPRRNERQEQRNTSSSDNWHGRDNYDRGRGGEGGWGQRQHRSQNWRDQDHGYGQPSPPPPRRDDGWNRDRPSHGHQSNWGANTSTQSSDGRNVSGWGSANEDTRVSKKPKVGEPPPPAAAAATANDIRGTHTQETAASTTTGTAPSSSTAHQPSTAIGSLPESETDADDSSLEKLVTKETMVEGKCSWDQMIAAQHPDMPTANRNPWPQGKTYLPSNKKIEQVLPTCPFGSLRDYSKGEAWFAKKKAAAKKVFEDVLAEAERTDFEYCPTSKEELRKFFDALPYNMTFLIGFDAIGIFPNDEKHCLCPCSKKCAKWRHQFGLEEILNDFSSDRCGKTFQSASPYGLMQHLEQKSKHEQGLHYYVKMYVQELYGPPYCGRVGHKGLYPPQSRESKEAESFELKENLRARRKLERELEEEREANRANLRARRKLERELEEEREANRAKEEEQEKRKVGVPALPPMGAAPPVTAVSTLANNGNSKSSSPLTYLSKRPAEEALKPAASSLGSSSSHSPAHVSTSNVFFTRALTVFQKEQLKMASVSVQSVFGMTDDEDFAEKVTNIYNARHVQRCGVDQVGFGGKLQVEAVKKFLREEGKRILDSQSGNRMAPIQIPMPPRANAPMQHPSAAGGMPPPVQYSYNSWRDNPTGHNNAVASIYGPPSSRASKKRKYVSAESVLLLTYKELGFALKEKGLPVGNKSEKRIRGLQKYFEGGGNPFSFDVDK